MTASCHARRCMADMKSPLDRCQLGLTKGLSASPCLVDLVQYILNKAEASNYVSLLATDYGRSFDKVDITVALQHLHQVNARLGLLPWIADFLSDRGHCIRLGPSTLDWPATTCEVGQKTKTVPVLFLAVVSEVATETDCCWKHINDTPVGVTCNPRTSTPATGLQNFTD